MHIGAPVIGTFQGWPITPRADLGPCVVQWQYGLYVWNGSQGSALVKYEPKTPTSSKA